MGAGERKEGRKEEKVSGYVCAGEREVCAGERKEEKEEKGKKKV